jgi:molecular chaperone GrpE
MTKKKEKDIVEQKDAEKEVQEEIVDMEEKKEVAEPEKKAGESENKEQEYLDGWKRCQADFENYKKRQAETQKDFIRFSTESVILQILPILDNFHASTDHVPKEQKDTPWVVGIMHIQKQLESVLTTYGVAEIETKVGDEFNPEIHEAIQAEENKTRPVKSAEGGPAKQEFNRVNKIVQKGYKMSDKVIRPARVIVG